MRYAAAIVSAGLALALGVIMAPAASAAPTLVSSCQTLASPGSYALSTDLAAVDATCIEITASDVQQPDQPPADVSRSYSRRAWSRSRKACTSRSRASPPPPLTGEHLAAHVGT
jgi:hypothetical protein